ncbi:helix-turn-helix domain-containing protein [Pikeienuella piscinae]|uniref:Helix-turn-helix domain-containing protein n=1 Tax=Pikeienuella piscinae TaxID=2748098 RepID=A0A7L5BXF5_9RHOB|nr:DUF6456 domain-containing protein [Pikeienuella piscinae]QIE54574.1 helix-turn-helix domain-containing protein [Pikeienuella piscinae]
MQATLDSLDRCHRRAQDVFAGANGSRAADVAVYLAHVDSGLTMRAIAKAQGRQPSTIMRAVRRIEALRDDPLVERALATLESGGTPTSRISSRKEPPMPKPATTSTSPRNVALTNAEQVALERLSEPEAFMLVANGAEKAGIFCAKNGFRKPLSLIPIGAATRFRTMDWVKCAARTDQSARYVLTATGRAMLRRRALEAQGNSATGLAEAPNVFSGQHQAEGRRRYADPVTGKIETIRVNVGESPLGWLARRKDANGASLLTPEEVEAGERLREDYELAQIGPKLGQDWSRFLAPIDHSSGPGRTPSEGPLFARERFTKAMETLGPGLADAALRICCFHEGLEATERRMGWSARSGKVVLKLALQRLVGHYGLLSRAA